MGPFKSGTNGPSTSKVEPVKQILQIEIYTVLNIQEHGENKFPKQAIEV